MLLEAQRRGHRLHYVRPGGLALRGGARGRHGAHAGASRDDPAATGSPWDRHRNSSFGPGQVVLMRKDPPVDADYLHDTQILGMAQRQGALVVNDPQGLRDFNEKLAALLFPQCCPPTLVSRDRAAAARPSSPSTARPCSSRWTAWAGARSSASAPATPTST